jgi:hypothetical protein
MCLISGLPMILLRTLQAYDDAMHSCDLVSIEFLSGINCSFFWVCQQKMCK